MARRHTLTLVAPEYPPMKKLLLTLSLAVMPSLASAQDQDVDVSLGAPGMPPVQMQMRVRGPNQPGPAPAPAPAPAPMPPPMRVVGQDTFEVDYSPLGGQASAISVVSPEGAPAQVWNEDGSLAGTWSVPFNFKGRGSTYYRFIVWAPSGSGEIIFDRKLETKTYLSGTLRMRNEGGRPHHQRPPPQQAQPAGPSCMPGPDFESLLAAIKNESFSSEKLDVLSLAAPNAWFTVDQVGRLVDAFDHSSDKVDAVRLTRTHLVDRQNGFKLMEHFTFSSDKEAVKALLQ